MTYIVIALFGFIYQFGDMLDGNIDIRESRSIDSFASTWQSLRMTRTATDPGPMLINTEFQRWPTGENPTEFEQFRLKNYGSSFGNWVDIPIGQFETFIDSNVEQVEFQWRLGTNEQYDPQSQYRVDVTVRRFVSGNPVFHQATNRLGTLYDFSDGNLDGVRNHLDVYVWRRLGNPYTAQQVKGDVIGTLMGNPPIRYGDFDGDGHCQFSDFVILSSWFGQTAGRYDRGDMDLDYDVDFTDFVIFSDEFEGAAGSLPPP